MRTILSPGTRPVLGMCYNKSTRRIPLLTLLSLSFLLSSPFSSTLHAQSKGQGDQHPAWGHVRITVIDSATHKPIPGVQISLNPFGKSGASGPTGRVVFPAVPVGKHILWITHNDYIPRTTEITVKAGDTIRKKFTLDSVTSYRRRNNYAADEIDAGSVSLEDENVDAFGMFGGRANRRSSSGVSIPNNHFGNHTNFDLEEKFASINENNYKLVSKDPLSTFSVDVDRASYSIVRKYLTTNQLPPQDAVRVEEMINYFRYDHPQPHGSDPVTIFTDMTDCPWNLKHKIVQIALKAKDIKKDHLPPSNLVFLIDVSGSMDQPDKLPLVQQAFRLLVGQLRPQDRVAIVVYAGAAGLVLPSTSGLDKAAILGAIDRLEAGGSTAGAAGINLAYNIAKENFLKNGNNRVILATDGDFNVGVSSDAELIRLIELKRNDGIFLTVLGFGDGNYQDNKMEQLADKGNGNYSYCDNLMEAQKVFVAEIGGTLNTVAKDVKLQIEFNPKHVQAYRLIGYENRKLENEDFNNDKKDAGDMGAGHEVTALYEIVPAGVDDPSIGAVDPLKYQTTPITYNPSTSHGEEVLTVKFRYKEPLEDVSKLVSTVLKQPSAKRQASDNLKFAMAVASFGMILRDSEHKGTATIEQALALAKEAKGADTEGYRAEFIRLATLYSILKISEPISE